MFFGNEPQSSIPQHMKDAPHLPLMVVGFTIAPFLDRQTLNSLGLASKETSLYLGTITRPWSQICLRLEAAAQCLSFSPDSAVLVCRDREGRIRAWERHNGKEVTFDGIKCSALSNISYSPQGDNLVFGIEGGALQLLAISDSKSIISRERHDGAIHAVVFAPDGLTIASGGTDGTIKIWESKSKLSCLQTMQGHRGCIYSISFSPDGSTVASSGTDTLVRVWNLSTSEQTLALEGHTAVVVSLCFSADGLYTASGSLDATVRLWNATDHRCIRVFDVYAEVLSVSFTMDSKTLANRASK